MMLKQLQETFILLQCGTHCNKINKFCSIYFIVYVQMLLKGIYNHNVVKSVCLLSV